jgi:hypothetical protein
MHKSRAALAAVGIALSMSGTAANADARADGQWRIDLTGKGPFILCYGTIGTTGFIRNGRPVYSGRTKYGYRVTARGDISFWAQRNADRATATGKLAQDFGSASGTFSIPTRNCTGTWRAVRLSKAVR